MGAPQLEEKLYTLGRAGQQLSRPILRRMMRKLLADGKLEALNVGTVEKPRWRMTAAQIEKLDAVRMGRA